MSVTFHLLKPLLNVTYMGDFFDYMTYKEFLNNELINDIEIANGLNDYENYEDFYSDQEKKKWSDNQKHEMFTIPNFYRGKKSCRSWKRLAKKFKNLNFKYFQRKCGETYKYIPVTEVLYYQGWFLRKKFFKKECTCYITKNKYEMLTFLRKYLDFKDNYAVKVYNSFEEYWEDGLIFECLF